MSNTPAPSGSLAEVTSLLDSLGLQYMLREQSLYLTMRNPRSLSSKAIPIEIRRSTHWLTVRAFLISYLPDTSLGEVSHFLAVLNAHSRMVRYCIHDGCVLVQHDIGHPNVNKRSVVEGLEAVSIAAGETTVTVVTLATNPSVHRLYARVQMSGGGREIAAKHQEEPLLESDINFGIKPMRIQDLVVSSRSPS